MEIDSQDSQNAHSDLRLRHYFTHFKSLGGVQSILKTHLELDKKSNLNSTLLAFFDPRKTIAENHQGLGLKSWDTIRGARRRFRNFERAIADISIFHDLWGLAFFGEFARTNLRRLGAIHSQWPHLDYQITQLRGSLDGIFCDSQIIAEHIASRLPELKNRICHLPVPANIASQKHFKKRPPMQNRRIILGFVGRIDFAQKRVDRLPSLLHYLHKKGLDCELQLLGSGKDERRLRAQFHEKLPVHFLGMQSGNDYWQALSKWDFVVFTSDHEGSPLAMIEAMSVGNIPLFPKIKSGGDAMVQRIHPALLYKPEAWNELAFAIEYFAHRPPNEAEQTREQCRQISLSHSPHAYHKQFMKFLDRVLSSPRLSRNFASRPFFFADHLPFGFLRKWHPKGFFNTNPIQKV